MRKHCLLVLLISAVSFAQVGVVSHWILPSPKKRDGEITQERTKPILVGDILYTASLSGIVSAVHRTDGYTFWQKKLEAGVEGCLGYGRSKIIVGDVKGNLYALNARDGSEAWRFKIQSEWVNQPSIVRDKVFVASSAEELFAFNESTGKEVWHYAHRGDEKMTVRGVAPTVVFGSEIFQGFADGSMVALNTSLGKVLWTKKLRTKDRFYDVDATPYVDDKQVITATFDGKLYNLNKSNGNTNWIHDVGTYGGFLVEGDKVYFAGLDGNFYALKKDSSTPVWKTPFDGGVGLQPARAGDYLVFTTSNDPTYLVDANDGKVVWKSKLGLGTLANPVASPDGWFYVLTNYGNLLSFSITNHVSNKVAPETIPLHSAIERNLALELNRKSP